MFDLILMRHAKSDWQYALPDIERPLNARGRRDARRMGEQLQHIDALPHRLVLSPAQRTRETAEYLLESVSDKPELIVDNDLYLADRDTLIELASAYASDNRRLMLLAHNPGMEEALHYLCAEQPALSSSGKLMPTCTLALLACTAAHDLERAHRCHLRTLIRPEDLR